MADLLLGTSKASLNSRDVLQLSLFCNVSLRRANFSRT
jgi:hypothetical protein